MNNIHENMRNISPFEEVCLEIEELYGEAKNWADGEDITTQAQHDTVAKLYKSLHEAGKKADVLRIDEKKPLDDQINSIQTRYNPYIQPKRGKVDVGKDALNVMLTKWRSYLAVEKAKQAEDARKAAAAAEAQAREAMLASRGNLEAREEAEKLVTASKEAAAVAARTEKAINKGTGLRTSYIAVLKDEKEAVQYFWKKNRQEFINLIQELADKEIRAGKKSIAGFDVVEQKKAV